MPQINNEARILLAFQAYKNDPKLSLRRAAKLYQVNHTTLLCRHNGVQTRANTTPESRKLSNLEGKIVIQDILDLSFPLRLGGVKKMTNRLLADRDVSPVGKCWARNFVKRHEELDTHFFRKYGCHRAKCEDPIIIDLQLRTPTPVEEETVPSTPWGSKTPMTVLEAEFQSEYLERRIRRHHSSSPKPILEALKSFSKRTMAIMHELALVKAEVQDL